MIITPEAIVEQTLMYSIVHGIIMFIIHILKKLRKEVRKQRNHIIERHVKAGHEGRLKHCVDIHCASLQSQQPVPLVQPVQADTGELPTRR